MNIRTAWHDILGHCQRLTYKQDAHYVNRRQRSRSAQVVKGLRQSDAGKALFKRTKKYGK